MPNRSENNSRSSTALWSALSLSLGLLSVGCGNPVKIYDDEFCADAGPYGARCFTVLSDRKRNIAPEVWNQVPAPGVSPSPDSRWGRISGTQAAFGHLKGNVLKLCQISGDCTYEEIKKIETFQSNLNGTQRMLNSMQKVMTR